MSASEEQEVTSSESVWSRVLAWKETENSRASRQTSAEQGVMDDQGSLHGSTSVAEGRERRSLRLSNAVRIKIYKENSNRSIYFDIAKRPLRAYDIPLQQFPKDRTLASRGWRGVRVRIETSSRTAQQLGRELPSSACPRVQHFFWLLFRA